VLWARGRIIVLNLSQFLDPTLSQYFSLGNASVLENFTAGGYAVCPVCIMEAVLLSGCCNCGALSVVARGVLLLQTMRYMLVCGPMAGESVNMVEAHGGSGDVGQTPTPSI
jgi:hypothetical protein